MIVVVAVVVVVARAWCSNDTNDDCAYQPLFGYSIAARARKLFS
jgi:hypothetical protein